MKKMGFYLDSATSKAVMALFEGELVFVHQSVNVGPLAKEDLFLHMDALLAGQGMTLKDITYLALGLGPGSYTGMRMASSIAATLAYSLGIPLVTLSSMEGYFYQAPFLTVFDAKRGKVYVREANGEPRLALVSDLKNFIDQGYFLVTPHLDKLRGSIQGNWVEGTPDLPLLAKISHQRFLLSEFTDPMHVQLFYLQNPYIS